MIILIGKHTRFRSGFCTENKNFLQWLGWMLLFMHLWQHDTISIIFLQVIELEVWGLGIYVFRYSWLKCFTCLLTENLRERDTISLRTCPVHIASFLLIILKRECSGYLFLVCSGSFRVCRRIRCGHVRRHGQAKVHASHFYNFATLRWWISYWLQSFFTSLSSIISDTLIFKVKMLRNACLKFVLKDSGQWGM